MIPSLHSGISALKSLTQGLQTLGNNISNVNSLGYKAARANFSDNFYMYINDAESGADGIPSNNLLQYGTGVHVSSHSTDFNQGTIELTGLDLDLAIQGEALPNGGGFFELLDPNSGEIFYTRAGAFESMVDGTVVTRDQYQYQLLDVNKKPVNVGLAEGETLLTRRVEEDGSIKLVVSVDGEDKIRDYPVGMEGEKMQLKIANFQSPQYLRRVGNGFYSNGQAGQNIAGLLDNGVPATGSNGKIKQYALELSNVDLTNEFASMISHQRSFQAGSRVITTSDAILNEAVNLKR